ncbi:MAG: methyltransferase [Pseudomonadota bacterium]
MTSHTPEPWETRVIPASGGLECTGYAHQIVKGGREYTVAFSDHQNWDYIHKEKLPDGYVRSVGIGKREPDLTPHPDARRIVAAVNACEGLSTAALEAAGARIALCTDTMSADLFEAMRMAIASARENFSAASPPPRYAVLSVPDCLHGVASNDADLILINPPFHQQHQVGDTIAWNMFKDARRVLRPGGELRVVGNRHLGYHAKLKKLFGNCETIAADSKFVLLKAIKLS